MATNNQMFARVSFCAIAMVALLVALPAAAQVAVIQVPSGGAPDIQTAVNQAATMAAGGTDVVIEVAPGTYTPSAAIQVGAITGPGTVILRGSLGPSQTTIDTSNVANYVIRGIGTKRLVIDGFTLRNRIPNQNLFVGGGARFVDADNITIANCHIDSSALAIFFSVDTPTLSAEYRVVNNTMVAGQGTDPNSPDTIFGSAASLTTNYPTGSSPTAEIRLIAAGNVSRTNASSFRFINGALDANGNITAPLSNGSLVMTGNDASSSIVAGANVLGGHAHIIAQNRIHNGANGVLYQSAESGVIENNLIVNNSEHGLLVFNFAPASQLFPGEPNVSVRHNTIGFNGGTGIVYLDETGSSDFLPNVYNNIITGNKASGLASVLLTSSTFAFVSDTFNLANDDVAGNSLVNINAPFFLFNYIGISNLHVARQNYSGVVNTGLDLSVNPKFTGAAMGEFDLQPSSPLVNAGLTSRPTPFQDVAGNLRDSAPDIGAFEVVAVGPSPSVTTHAPSTETKKSKVAVQ